MDSWINPEILWTSLWFSQVILLSPSFWICSSVIYYALFNIDFIHNWIYYGSINNWSISLSKSTHLKGGTPLSVQANQAKVLRCTLFGPYWVSYLPLSVTTGLEQTYLFSLVLKPHFWSWGELWLPITASQGRRRMLRRKPEMPHLFYWLFL